jgi:hypothetical protein
LQFTYIVRNENQVLPYCVAVVKNDEGRSNVVNRIMETVSRV